MRGADQDISLGIHNIGKPGILIKGKRKRIGDAADFKFLNQITFLAIRKMNTKNQIKHIHSRHAADMRINHILIFAPPIKQGYRLLITRLIQRQNEILGKYQMNIVFQFVEILKQPV